MMPRDANALGTIFGSVILSHIDIAATIEGHRYHPGRIVTVPMDQIVFLFFTETVRDGTTSVTRRCRFGRSAPEAMNSFT